MKSCLKVEQTTKVKCQNTSVAESRKKARDAKRCKQKQPTETLRNHKEKQKDPRDENRDQDEVHKFHRVSKRPQRCKETTRKLKPSTNRFQNEHRDIKHP